MADKKYIEWILYNEEHMSKVNEIECNLMKLFLEEDTMDDLEYRALEERIKLEINELIFSNYYLDEEIADFNDWWGMLELGNIHYFGDLIFEVKKEVELRKKRKRPYTKMWEKLHAVGLVDASEIRR